MWSVGLPPPLTASSDYINSASSTNHSCLSPPPTNRESTRHRVTFPVVITIQVGCVIVETVVEIRAGVE
jgi:hypothetical protein